MSQENQFHQFGYDHYLKAPQKPGIAPRPRSRGLLDKIKGKFESPLFATASLLIAGAAFAGIIVMAYPSDNSSDVEVPVVKADLRPIKIAPEDHGGMQVPYRDSTVLADIGGQPQYRGDSELGLENLLAQDPDGDLSSKEDALAQAVSDRRPDEMAGLAGDAEDSPLPQQVLQKIDSSVSREEPMVAVKAQASVKPPANLDEAQAIASSTSKSVDERPRSMHAAATSPETIDFVKSVMDKDGADELTTSSAAPEVKAVAKDVAKSAQAISKIEPAAGVASPGPVNITGGQYYVQLASITARDRADSEWKKLKASFSSQLSASNYRVQQADLGAKGTFYRIQAGPFSKNDATSICNAIKAQKPGGCLVVK